VYLPKAWTDDRARCAVAGVPDDVRFATKITLAQRMLARALDAGVPAAWATADEFYGGDQNLRRDLQTRGIGYVLTVAKSHRVTTPPGRRPGTRRPTRRHPAEPGVEPNIRRDRVERRAVLRMGVDHHHPTRRLSQPADPPPDQRRRAGLLPLLAPDRCRCEPWSGSPEPGGTWRWAIQSAVIRSSCFMIASVAV
jgi:hypothetical protein